MKVFGTPGYIETHLEEDMGADIGGSGDIASGDAVADLESSIPQGDPSGSQGEPESEVFFEFDYGEKDGEARKGQFKTADEMKDWYRENYLMHSDYTKKTQSVAEQRKEIESAREKFEAEQTAYLQMSNKYRDWDEKFDKLGPAARKQIEQVINGYQRVSPEMRAIQERLDASDNEKKTAAEERKKAEAQAKQEQMLSYTNKYLASKYKGYDSAAVQKKVQAMRSGTPEQQFTALLEAIHLSDLYKNQGVPPKKSPYSGGATPNVTAKPIKHKNSDEAVNAAIAELT